MSSRPVLARHPGVLSWAVPHGWVALSSASVGGGLVRPRWVLNVDVGGEFDRTDLDGYARDVADRLGLDGSGCALLTAADVGQVQHVEHEGVDAWATVGVTKPTWAVRSSPVPAPGAPAPGTINIVVAVPVALSSSALVQAVGTVTEAKAQALVQAGVPGTGTASDALVVLAPVAPQGIEVPFAGVRSVWGERIARAVHGAVLAGLGAHPWPQSDTDPAVVW